MYTFYNIKQITLIIITQKCHTDVKIAIAILIS